MSHTGSTHTHMNVHTEGGARSYDAADKPFHSHTVRPHTVYKKKQTRSHCVVLELRKGKNLTFAIINLNEANHKDEPFAPGDSLEFINYNTTRESFSKVFISCSCDCFCFFYSESSEVTEFTFNVMQTPLF